MHPRMDVNVAAKPLRAAIAAEKARFRRYCDTTRSKRLKSSHLCLKLLEDGLKAHMSISTMLLKALQGQRAVYSSNFGESSVIALV